MGTSVIYSSLSHPSLTISHLKTINLYYWQYKLVVPCNFKLQSTIMLQILWNLSQQEWRYPNDKLRNIRRTNQHWQTYSNTCTTLCWNLSKILCKISLKKGCHWTNKLITFLLLLGRDSPSISSYHLETQGHHPLVMGYYTLTHPGG